MATICCDDCSWRDEILAGISMVPKLASPGAIQVYGAHAHPVLVASSGDVIMAAAEVGSGRIVVISHGTYIKGFVDGNGVKASLRELHDNIKKWVSRGAFKDHCDVQNVRELKNVSDAPPVILCDGKSVRMQGKIIDYLQKGGGVVYGLCPWGWKQLNKGKDDFPLSKLMKLSGMSFTDRVAKIDDAELAVTEASRRQAHLSNLGTVCRHCLCHQDLLTEFSKPLVRGILIASDDIIETLSRDLDHLHAKYAGILETCIPSPQHKIKSPEEVALINIFNVISLRGKGFTKLPGIENFPGDFPADTVLPLKCVDISITSPHAEIHPLGYYLPAGIKMVVQVQNISSGSAEIIIGAHRDMLHEKAELKRWPILSSAIVLRVGKETIASPCGGQLYLRCPKNSKVTLHLDGVLESPVFRLGDNARSGSDADEGESGNISRCLGQKDTLTSWLTARRAPGLWADVVGRYIRFTMPSSSVRDLDDPSVVMAHWDKVVEAYHDLRGTDVTKCRKEWFVCDAQPSVGYMHSGYPIVTHLDVSRPDSDKYLLNDINLQRGFWGAFHELGHNMQRPWWTISGAGEVTCNIFTLYAMEVICGVPLSDSGKIPKGLQLAQTYMEGGAQFSAWKKKPFLALVIYMQLAHYFGWNAYRAVFRAYEQLPKPQRPKTNQAKLDLWVEIFSKEVNLDLRPLFDLWSWPYSAELVLPRMPLFLPCDAVSILAGSKVQTLLKKYHGQGQIIRSLTDKAPFGETRSPDDTGQVVDGASESCVGSPDGAGHDDDSADCSSSSSSASSSSSSSSSSDSDCSDDDHGDNAGDNAKTTEKTIQKSTLNEL